jgi:hypothetical protein
MFGWPGQASEAKDICKVFHIVDVNTTDKSKNELRNILTDMCHVENRHSLRSIMEGKTKCRRILSDGYGRNEYLSRGHPHQVWEHFSTGIYMLPITGNFSKERRFLKTDLKGRCKKSREEEKHIKQTATFTTTYVTNTQI